MVESIPVQLEVATAHNPAHSAALAKLFARIGELTTLPSQTTRLLALIDDDTSSIDDIVKIVNSDPPIAARVLQRINSTYYSLPNRVDQIPLAVSMLGMKEIRNIALTASLSRLFCGSDSVAGTGGYKREELWQFSVAVARTSAMIATHSTKVSVNSAYAAGLLHDIGYFLLDQHLQKHFVRFIALAKHKPKESSVELERQTFSFHHGGLGAFAAAHWELPRPICDAIEYHHYFDEYRGSHREIVASVALADQLVRQAGCAPLGLNGRSMNLDTLRTAAQIPETDLAGIRKDLAKVLDDMRTPLATSS